MHARSSNADYRRALDSYEGADLDYAGEGEGSSGDLRRFDWVLDPAERIGPRPRDDRSLPLRIAVLAVLTTGGTAAMMNADKLSVPEWVTSEVATLAQTVERAVARASEMPPMPKPRPLDPAAVPSAPASEASPPAEVVPEPVKEAVKQVEEAPLTTGAIPVPAAGEGLRASEPLPKPDVDPANPYQKKAQAAGLHPGLSQVVLKRLTGADYKNAGYAIKTALAETPDHEIFVWPRQRTPEQALFHVKFVEGAAKDCRRYVVSITKDGWLTTALPMETCGIKRAVAQRKP